LEDKTKVGHRKILVFFLINPKVPILSTSDVPPQQKEWIKKEMNKFKVFGNVPEEIVSLICEFLEYPIEIESTKMDREKLMEERKYIQFIVEKSHFLRSFSLCEH
jgi:hypothetical protein